MNKTANCVSSSVDFLVWSRGGNTRMGMFGGRIRLVPNRSFLSLSDSRQLSRVSIGCLVHAAPPLSPPYLCRRGPPNSSLAVYWPQYWPLSFFLCPLSAPLLFKQVLRSTSLAGLPFRLGLGRVMDAFGYSSGLLAQFASCPYSDAVSFSRWFGSLYCISVFLTHGVVLYIYLFCGFHRGLLCNDITSFSTRTQVPGGHLWIVSMRVWRDSLKLA